MATMVQAVRMALLRRRSASVSTSSARRGPPLGGVFRVAASRRRGTPLDERGIIGTAIGLRWPRAPVCEIQFCDYAFNTIDLLKLAGAMYWSSNGQWALPMVMMTPVGSGIHGSIYHSHSFDATATHIPGWKIVMPSNPRDAYGLMLSAIRDPNPVMFLMPKALLRAKALPGEEIPGEPDERTLSKLIDAPLGDRSKWAPSWPETPDLFVPIGEARTVRPGRDVTCVTYGAWSRCARRLRIRWRPMAWRSRSSISARSSRTTGTPSGDIRRTNRVLFVNEDTEVTNFGEHLVRRTVDELFYELYAPPRLLAGAFVPGVGLADNLEQASVPQKTGIVAAMKELARLQP